MWVLEQVLGGGDPERLPFKVGNLERLHTLETGWELIRRAVDARTGDPALLRALAGAAAVVAERIGDAELRLRARAEIANSHRIRGDVRTAVRLFDEATLAAVEELPDATRAEVYVRYADVLVDDLKADAAVPYVVRAVHLARATPLAAEYRVDLTRVLIECKRFRAAQRYLNEALLDLQHEQPERPRVLAAAFANAVHLFVEWARASDSPLRRRRMLEHAERALGPARAYLERHGFERWMVTLEWVVARGQLETGQHELAVAALDGVVNAYLRMGDAPSAALAALDLGEAHLGRGELHEIRALGAGCSRVFEEAFLPFDLAPTFARLEEASSLRKARALIRSARRMDGVGG